jgi:hypothetical protein
MRSETQRGSAEAPDTHSDTSIDRYAAARGKVFLLRWGAPSDVTSDVPKSAFCCESVSLWERVTYFRPHIGTIPLPRARGGGGPPVGPGDPVRGGGEKNK